MKIKRKRIRTKVLFRNKAQHEEDIQTFKNRVASIESLDQVISLDETRFSNVSDSFWGYIVDKNQRTISVPKKLRNSCAVGITTKGVLWYQNQLKAFKTDSFKVFFERLLQENKHCKYVIMDNICFHRSKEITSLAEKYNITIIPTPAYSPQFNPIEHFFSQVKNTFRKRFLETQNFQECVNSTLEEASCKNVDFTKTFSHSIYYSGPNNF